MSKTIERRKFMDVSIELTQDKKRGVITRVYHEKKYFKRRLGFTDWKKADPSERELAYAALEKAYEEVKSLYSSHGTFNLDMLKQKKIAVNSFNDYIMEKIESLEAKHSYSTSTHYRSALKIFEKLFGAVPIEKLSPKHFIAFRKYLQDEDYSDSTAKIYLSDFKSVCNWLIYKKIMKEENYPFRRCIYDTEKVDIPRGSKRVDWYLDKDQVRQIYDWWIEHRDPLIRLWLFSYLTGGMNLADALQLRADNRWGKSNGKEFSYYRLKTRAKNDFPTVVPVTKWLEPLINLDMKVGDRFFDYIKDKMTPLEVDRKVAAINNKVSRKICKLCNELEIEKGRKVTVTWARHSFATVLTRERVPANYIEYSMCHCNNGVSAHYIGGYTTEQMAEYSSLLL